MGEDNGDLETPGAFDVVETRLWFLDEFLEFVLVTFNSFWRVCKVVSGHPAGGWISGNCRRFERGIGYARLKCCGDGVDFCIVNSSAVEVNGEAVRRLESFNRRRDEEESEK